jgi:regulator of sirC expression with transglutaminase-like and TPR domain
MSDRAIADFTEAIRLDPKDYYQYRDRALVYDAMGDHARAQADRQAAERLLGR